MRYLPFLLYLGVTVYAIVDVAQHRDDEPYRLTKVVWILVILIAPLVGAVAWLVAKWSSGGGRSPQRQAPQAPDDDPDFKTWAAEQERRRRQEGR